MSLTFRWLGCAGLELNAGGKILAIDPFFSRPSLAGLIQPVAPNPDLVTKYLPYCHWVLVTHSHWDHIMDVPHVLLQSGAVGYGSPNTCQLLIRSGVPAGQVNVIQVGDQLTLGPFKVEVIRGQHSPIPFSRVFNGPLDAKIQPPFKLQDYKMDTCLGFRIRVMGLRLLICAGEFLPAEVLFPVAQESPRYYQLLFEGSQAHTVVPIHWDAFTRPLSKPLQRFTRPGGMSLWQLTRLARHVLPHAKVKLPELFKIYTLDEGDSSHPLDSGSSASSSP